MRFVRWTLAAGTAAGSVFKRDVNNTSPAFSDFTATDIESGSAFNTLSNTANERMRVNIDGRQNPQCTFNGSAVRAEFRSMSFEQRKAFTDAITCLQSIQPVYLPADEISKYPGIKSRYDEYVATHINYTTSIHLTASFFAWHRFFIHQFEQDLQSYCGYTGNLPYWNWAYDAASPQDSELFNGNPWSMGSNGAYVGNRSYTYLGLQNVYYPPGTGGGCVTNGPFSNYTVRMGPLDSPYNDNVNSTFEHNPRCLVRDINAWFSTQYNTYYNVTDLLLNNIYIQDFQAIAQGINSPTNKFGVHGGGHWTMGGPSTLADFHASPGDPLFFMHHAMIDHIWVIWQYLDIWDRQQLISGTSTMNNDPPSPEMTLEDILPFGFVAPAQRFGDLMDTLAGPLCYRYE